jgi:hypothetical protein
MELLLVNPRRRRKRKLSAKQRKYFGKRKRRTSSHRRRRRRSHAVAAPRRRRRRSHAVHRIRRRKRNPSLRGITGQIVPAVKAGLIGAAGGLGLSVALGYLGPKLPAQLQSGYALTAVKVLGALGVGILGGMALRGKGNALAQGAMTVVVYDELKKVIATQFPAVPLGEYMSIADPVGYDPALELDDGSGEGGDDMGEYMMGEYASDSDESVFD